MRMLALSATFVLATLAQAGAQSLPTDETTYVEHSLNHTDTLVIEHQPVAENPYGSRTGQAAIAGYCRDGGLVRRRDAFGNPVIIRQREICDGVAPRTLDPGEVDPRPAWPADAVARERVLRAKG